MVNPSYLRRFLVGEADSGSLLVEYNHLSPGSLSDLTNVNRTARQERLSQVWQNFMIQMEALWLDILDEDQDLYIKADNTLKELRGMGPEAFESAMPIISTLTKILGEFYEEERDPEIKLYLSRMKSLGAELEYIIDVFKPKHGHLPDLPIASMKKWKRGKADMGYSIPDRGDPEDTDDLDGSESSPEDEDSDGSDDEFNSPDGSDKDEDEGVGPYDDDRSHGVDDETPDPDSDGEDTNDLEDFETDEEDFEDDDEEDFEDDEDEEYEESIKGSNQVTTSSIILANFIKATESISESSRDVEAEFLEAATSIKIALEEYTDIHSSYVELGQVFPGSSPRVDVYIEWAIPISEQTLKDASGKTIGMVKVEDESGVMTIRDSSGKFLGGYDPKTDETRNGSGRLIGRGNMLSVLLVNESSDFKEPDHPRDNEGQFSSTGGGGGSSQPSRKMSKTDFNFLAKKRIGKKVSFKDVLAQVQSGEGSKLTVGSEDHKQFTDYLKKASSFKHPLDLPKGNSKGEKLAREMVLRQYGIQTGVATRMPGSSGTVKIESTRPSDCYGYSRLWMTDRGLEIYDPNDKLVRVIEVKENSRDKEVAEAIYESMTLIYDVDPFRVLSKNRVIPAVYRMLERRANGESVQEADISYLLSSLRVRLGLNESVSVVFQEISLKLDESFHDLYNYYFHWDIPGPAIDGNPDDGVTSLNPEDHTGEGDIKSFKEGKCSVCRYDVSGKDKYCPSCGEKNTSFSEAIRTGIFLEHWRTPTIRVSLNEKKIYIVNENGTEDEVDPDTTDEDITARLASMAYQKESYTGRIIEGDKSKSHPDVFYSRNKLGSIPVKVIESLDALPSDADWYSPDGGFSRIWIKSDSGVAFFHKHGGIWRKLDREVGQEIPGRQISASTPSVKEIIRRFFSLE